MSGLHNFLIAIGTKASSLIISLVIQVSLAFFLGVEDRGAYAIVFTYVHTISFLFLVGIDTSIVYFISSKKITLSEGVTYSVLLMFCLSIFAVIFSNTLIISGISFFEKAPILAFKLGIVQIPFIMFSMVILNIYTATNNYKYYSRMVISNSILQASLLFLLTWFFKYGITGAILSSLIPSIFITIFSLYNLNKKNNLLFPKISSHKLRLIVRYGLKYYLGQISTFLNFQSPILFLGMVATKSDIGIFSIAAQLTAKSMVLSDAILLVLFPKISKNNLNKEFIVSLSFKLVLLLMLCILPIVIIFANEIIIFLFGNEYIAAVLATRILCIAYIMRASGKVIESYFLGINKEKIVTYSASVAFIVNTLTLLNFHIGWGNNVAAIAMLLSFTTSTIILILSYRYIGNISYGSIFFLSNKDIYYLKEILNRLKP